MSNWKDTVMSDEDLQSIEELELYHFKSKKLEKAIAQAQAEISFKAGIKEVVDNPKYFIDMEAHKRGDTDDLIMWGWEQAANSKEGQVVLIAVPKEKLKEWGIIQEGGDNEK